ncbi:hypothetical protein I4U23_019713 [Adineta vaga]|nr:hypothetical protein I4U23_019713 [Adineta vaga]
MDAFSVLQQPRLSIDRVINLEFQELVECGVCHGIILDPVGCYNCDRAVCSACIHQLNAHREESICPYGCTTYTERSCPKAIAHILSSLNIICQYKSNGCDAILSYNNIINHEKDCDYQLWSCIGCQQLITKKNFQEHNNQCPLISLICDECSSSFQRKDTNSHTLIDCLHIQLQNKYLK